MKILVTGGAGFIGSHLVKRLVLHNRNFVVNVDALTLGGHQANLEGLADCDNYLFFEKDIRDRKSIDQVFAENGPDAVIHMAAESHVDRSITEPASFIETNILGTYNLLEAARTFLDCNPQKREKFRFIHVSTDEVFGSMGETESASEDFPYRPNSPYSASKAASDHLVRAWHKTFGLPTIVTNCSNNYGPNQMPEKLIPRMILNAISGIELPVYGDGKNIRDWIHVSDHVAAIETILERGTVGESYNIGGGNEVTNIEIVKTICKAIDEGQDLSANLTSERLIRFVEDRPGHDFKYSLDSKKLQREIGWSPEVPFREGLEATVKWYLENPKWLRKVRGKYTEQVGASIAPQDSK